MSCAEMRVLLHGMLDHELDLADAVRVEAHIQACHDCTAEYRRQGALRAAIRWQQLRYRAPHDLRARVMTSIRMQTDVSCRAPWWRGAVTGWLGHRRVIGLRSESVVCRRDAWRASNSARADLRTRPIVAGEPSQGCNDFGRAHGQAMVQRQARRLAAGG